MELKNPKTEALAQQIAAHVKNNDLNIAKDMFERNISGAKHWEAIALKDRIFEIAKFDD